MLDITSDDIKQLNGSDLRELVARLCEAELVNQKLSPSAVTWGGNHTAPDGGLDVRVELPPEASIDGFLPRRLTGIQVRAKDMPKAAILTEMRPEGAIRPVIKELANGAGAYLIVSSIGSTSDSALRNRRDAMREALGGLGSAQNIHTDFYDRNRLATWVRFHPGLIIWVKEKTGRAVVGWRSYGPWSGVAEGVAAEYLLDDKIRLQLGRRHNAPAQSVAQAIDELRDELAQPGKIVRLVGLSGVGKTRLVQALFDARIGSRPLPTHLAVYTNLSDNPDPQPIGLASDLLANRKRAIVIVDNCPPELHRRLSELCGSQDSTLSVLTVEYDVRDDEPERTQVVRLDVSSPELIEKLVRRRYPHISQVDAHTIAEASGGNARIAICLAETVGQKETIGGLSNDELFQRLFRQRNDPDNALLLAAKACSLVYSFQGEALEGDEAELSRLALLAGQTTLQTYRHIGELFRRNLVQQRGAWRAVLPHAIANRLAAHALEDTPYDLINQQLIAGGTARLARSFSRRLSFLHDHPKAVAIVKGWLDPGGLLADATVFNDLGRAMFENVAPVLPEMTLTVLERAGDGHAEVAAMVWPRHLLLLRSLAYDPHLFERSAQMLVRAATQNGDQREAKEASNAFVSLFTIYLSGTHASIEQRLAVIEALLKSGDTKERLLGLEALDQVLEATHFSSWNSFEFGARSRDYGYHPQSHADVSRWYGAALKLIERMVLTAGLLKPELRELLARKFRSLWTFADMHAALERISRDFAADGFWREGWYACRTTMRFDREHLMPEVTSRLLALESDLRPSNLLERVQAFVLGDNLSRLDPEDMEGDENVTGSSDRLEVIARELGTLVAADDAAFNDLLPDLLRGGNRAWAFGRGLAGHAPDPCDTWTRFVEELERVASEQRDIQVLRGFLAELWEKDEDLAQSLLDEALEQPSLVAFLPALHSMVELDERGVERLIRALGTGHVPILMYRNLAFGRVTERLSGDILKDLLLLIADQPDGFDVALEILYMRLPSDCLAQRKCEPELLQTGLDLLHRMTFQTGNRRSDHMLAKVIKAFLTGPDSGPIAAEIALRLSQAVSSHTTHALNNEGLLRALLSVQPVAVLETLFSGSRNDQQAGVGFFDRFENDRDNPADAISGKALIAWCEGDRVCRYSLAASIITFASHEETTGARNWSEQAKLLFVNAPDPRKVLDAFIKRFRPMRWSGTRATLMEANARLLDNLDSLVPSDLMPFVFEARAQLVREGARERQSETERDRIQDERFEW